MRTAKFAVINDSSQESRLIREGILSACEGRWLAQIYDCEDSLHGIFGSRFDFVFVDVSCLSLGCTEELMHSHRRISRYMNLHPSHRVVITTRLSGFFLRETKEEIESDLENPKRLFFLHDLTRESIGRVIADGLPMHLKEYTPTLKRASDV